MPAPITTTLLIVAAIFVAAGWNVTAAVISGLAILNQLGVAVANMESDG